jgi:hypothetical protein
MAVPRVLPTIAGNFVGSTDAARRQYHGFGTKQMKPPAVAIISKRTRDAISIFQQRDDRMFHENIQAQVYSMVLKCADHLQSGAIANVREARITMPAEIPLEDPPVAGAIKKSSPRFQFPHTCWCFLGVHFCHTPVIQVLAAAHRVRKVDAPTVSIVHVPHRGCDTALRHYGMSFAQE